jgi:hypothetical protein
MASLIIGSVIRSGSDDSENACDILVRLVGSRYARSVDGFFLITWKPSFEFYEKLVYHEEKLKDMFSKSFIYPIGVPFPGCNDLVDMHCFHNPIKYSNIVCIIKHLSW